MANRTKLLQALSAVPPQIVGRAPAVQQFVKQLVFDFTDLLDVPSSYQGEAGKVLAVNSTEDGLTFQDAAQPFTPVASTPTTLNEVIAAGSALGLWP